MDDFNRKYAAIIEDSKAVIAGLGLGTDFKDGRELALNIGGFVPWNALIDGRPENFPSGRERCPLNLAFWLLSMII